MTTPPTQSKTKPKQKSAWRQNVESMLVAVALALLIRGFLVEAFKIPTGSMAPTLLGKHKIIKCPNCGLVFDIDRRRDLADCPNCGYELKAYENHVWGGNRILVNKCVFRFGKPKRWDVIVFKYPLVDIRCRVCGYTATDQPADIARCPNPNCPTRAPNYRGPSLLQRIKWFGGPLKKKRKNFIKRLIGLPGETLLIRNGDIYINGKIARKTEAAQRSLWFEVYDEQKPSRLEVVSPAWELDSRAWRTTPRGLTFSGGTGPAYAIYNRPIVDTYGYNGVPLPWRHTVGDVRVIFEAKLAEDSAQVGVVLQEDDNVFTVWIRGKQMGGGAILRHNGKLVASCDTLALGSNREYLVDVANCDDCVKLIVDGRTIFRYDYEMPIPAEGNRESEAGVKLAAAGGGVTFSHARIYRDVFYSEMGYNYGVREPLVLKSNEYFVLGDNSPNSKDGRKWGTVPEKNLVGRAFFVWWPPLQVRPIQ